MSIPWYTLMHPMEEMDSSLFDHVWPIADDLVWNQAGCWYIYRGSTLGCASQLESGSSWLYPLKQQSVYMPRCVCINIIIYICTHIYYIYTVVLFLLFFYVYIIYTCGIPIVVYSIFIPSPSKKSIFGDRIVHHVALGKSTPNFWFHAGEFLYTLARNMKLVN